MGCLLSVCFAGVKEDRAKAETLRRDGNWKEALELGEAMYAPELRANSDEMKVEISE